MFPLSSIENSCSLTSMATTALVIGLSVPLQNFLFSVRYFCVWEFSFFQALSEFQKSLYFCSGSGYKLPFSAVYKTCNTLETYHVKCLFFFFLQITWNLQTFFVMYQQFVKLTSFQDTFLYTLWICAISGLPEAYSHAFKSYQISVLTLNFTKLQMYNIHYITRLFVFTPVNNTQGERAWQHFLKSD